jgi:hypothetical protein
MLKSNWTQGSAQLFGCRVIRQRIGKAPRRKSNAVHVPMERSKLEALCAALEAAALRR